MNDPKKAVYWKADENNAVRCGLCPHRCHISENASGRCGVRENKNGALIASSYGQLSSVALDPIEKKPLYMFYPGKRILSIGGYGCNFRCRFCQNYEISAEYSRSENSVFGIGSSEFARIGRPSEPSELRQVMMPEDVVALAAQTVRDGNIGVAYTYNEPLIGYEFLHDCAVLARDRGLYNVIVTNGFINREPLEALLPLIDAMNIDLKGFTDEFYKAVGGNLENVMETIAVSAKRCHVEVTTLVIPGENESDIPEIANWLSSIDPNIPLHLTRFFPRYRMSDRTPTPRETILKLRETAQEYLKNVFAGNMG